MSKFTNHRYCWSRPFTAVRHEWSLVAASMAVSFHVSVIEGHEDIAGLEFHYFDPPSYMKGNSPSHIDCPYTGGRCWHDGTSLYAMETLWPMVKPMLLDGDHQAIFRFLEKEVSIRHEREAEESKGGAR